MSSVPGSGRPRLPTGSASGAWNVDDEILIAAIQSQTKPFLDYQPYNMQHGLSERKFFKLKNAPLTLLSPETQTRLTNLPPRITEEDVDRVRGRVNRMPTNRNGRVSNEEVERVRELLSGPAARFETSPASCQDCRKLVGGGPEGMRNHRAASCRCRLMRRANWDKEIYSEDLRKEERRWQIAKHEEECRWQSTVESQTAALEYWRTQRLTAQWNKLIAKYRELYSKECVD